MLNSFRNFSKSIWAKAVMIIIIIAFVTWGMGGVFSGGNKNTLAKINNINISTQDFIDHKNLLQISDDMIRDNIDKSLIEQILNDLINKKLLSMEIEELKINISDSSLAKILKKNKNFLDMNNKFSRVKYEKYLLTNNISANYYENKLKENELQKILFNYIGGGIISPKFLINETFNNQNKIITADLVKLQKIYDKKILITKNKIREYIDNNKENLKIKKISINIAKIDPQNLNIGEEFNEIFFKKMDEIENEILNDVKFENIIEKYKLKFDTYEEINENSKNIFTDLNITQENLVKIFSINETNTIQILDNDSNYIIFVINKIIKEVPDINSDKFIKEIREYLINQEKNLINTKLLEQIESGKFKKSNFKNLITENDLVKEKIIINGIRDDTNFNKDTLDFIFAMTNQSFSLVMNKKNEISLISIDSIDNKNIKKNNKDYDKYYLETGINIKNNMYASYDIYLNNKYKIKINEQTMERLKNFFK